MRRRWLGLFVSSVLVACSTTEGETVSTDTGVDTGTPPIDSTLDDVGDDAGDDASDVVDTASDGTASDVVDTASDAGDVGDTTPGDVLVDTAPFVCDGGADGGADVGDASTGADPVLSKVGVAGKVLLRGMVVTPDTAFAGEVLVEGDLITCAAASCASMAGAATASIVETHGVILPGFIDTHNHILFDIFDETDWAPTKSYANHNQWTAEARYGAMVDTKQYLNGEAGSTWDFGCEMDKFGELKGLVSGTTSIVGATNPANRACYGSLARTVDQSPNGLGSDKVQVATLFPTKSSADGVCTNVAGDKTDAYLIHIAEGIDATALGEFAKLGTITTTAGCLYAPETTIVHGTALGDAEFTTMAGKSMGLTWSPRSNVFLYGAGIDLTKTTNVPLAIGKGINVALAPDWSMGGSQNLLDELRFADKVDNGVWGNVLTPKMLVQMVTTNAAKNLGLSAVIGSIAAGKKADLFVISGDPAAPYDSVLAARPRDVHLVMVGGVALSGDLSLAALQPAGPACETIDVCCASKFVCVAKSGGTTTDKLGQSYADITGALEKALIDYDALKITTNTFAPLTPLVRCE